MKNFNIDPYSKSNARVVISQSKKQSDWVYNIYHLFKEFAASHPRESSSFLKETGNTRHYIWFQTRALPCFNELYAQFYKNKIKIIPLNIIELLTPISLAYWIMGDGTWTGSGLRLHTDNSKVDEVHLLIKCINIKFSLNSTINVANKSRGQYSIYIPKKDMQVVRNIVSPYLLHTFLYKLGI